MTRKPANYSTSSTLRLLSLDTAVPTYVREVRRYADEIGRPEWAARWIG